MPLKLNLGISKKIGLPDYGSLGASCHVEVDLDSGLLRDDLDGFHNHVQNVFTACRQAVHDELTRQRTATGNSSTQETPAHDIEQHTGPRPNGNSTHGNGGNRHGASQKQRNYMNQLAGQIQGLGVRRLESLSQKMFGKPLADISSLDASALIDTLKAIKDGMISLDDALNGAPA